MSKAIITEGLLDDIADAIIAKGGAFAAMTPAQMASAIAQIPGGGGDNVKYTRVTLTGDTTIKVILDALNYEVMNPNALIFIRSSGDAAPTSGNYVLNNFIWIWFNGTRFYGRHYYKGKANTATPNSFPDLPSTNENNTNVSIIDGVLTYTGSTMTSCSGTTGDIVTIAEVPIDIDNAIMNGGTI